MGNLSRGAGPRGPGWTLVLGLALLLSGVLPASPPAQSPPDPGSPVEEGLLAVCDQAAQAFLSAFQKELAQEKGTGEGPRFFRTRLAELEKGFSGPGIGLGLMGRGFGGREDRRDVFDRTALAGFARAGEGGAETLGFFINPQGRGRTYRFFRRVRAQESCLACHGPREGLSLETRAALEREFPGFAGYGFKVGDLLGAVGIRVANPPGG